MREGHACCAVLDCRVTGKPLFDRKVFVCTKHMSGCSERALNQYTVAAGKRKSAEAREARGGRSAIPAAAAETTGWGRLIGEITAKFPLKPEVEFA